jgi:hypothetical protein
MKQNLWIILLSLSAALYSQVPYTPSMKAPSNGTQFAITEGYADIKLEWSMISGATSYYVQVSSTTSFSSYWCTTNFEEEDSSYYNEYDQQEITFYWEQGYVEFPAIPGTTYYWRVNASDSSGYSPWSTVDSFSIVGPSGAPTAPAIFNPAPSSDYQVLSVPRNPLLQWSSILDSELYRGTANATKYTVQLSLNDSFASARDTIVSTQAWSVGILSANTTYYWRVNAFNSFGTSSWVMSCFTTDAEGVLKNPTCKQTAALGYRGSVAVYALNGRQIYSAPFDAASTKEGVLRLGNKPLATGVYRYCFLKDRKIVDAGNLFVR